MRKTVPFIPLHSSAKAGILLIGVILGLGSARADEDPNEALRQQVRTLQKEKAALESWTDSLEKTVNEKAAVIARLEAATAELPQKSGPPAGGSEPALAEANRALEASGATVAELTVANEKLQKDLENALKSTAAALTAQSQAVTAASPDAYRMEIGTLTARIKELEGQIEEDRGNAAREITTLVSQLQRTRETSKSLTEANRALLAARDSETTTSEDLRQAGLKQAAELHRLTQEHGALQAQLADARQVAAALPGLADEKAALQERLETVGNQLVQLQHDHEELQKANADLTQQLAAGRQALEKGQADLTALQGRAVDAEKAVEAHTASVAELTQANEKLELQQEDMRRLMESYRADIARLTQTVQATEQQKAEAERSGQQNIDAVTAQLVQSRRELDGARTAQARLTENLAAQDRDRTAVIAQLRTENTSLAARLNQAQGTLDQIAAAARLGTPASTIAAGRSVPVRPAAAAPAPEAEARFHTVTEGDSLSRISLRYYGTPNRWQEIFSANRDVLQGSSALRVGMQLRIP